MNRVRVQEMCELKKPTMFYPKNVWKVTSRYVLQLSAKKEIPCVRVSSLTSSPTIILHLSVAEYQRLFRPLESR